MPLWLTKVPGLQAVRRASSRQRASRAIQRASSLKHIRGASSHRGASRDIGRASSLQPPNGGSSHPSKGAARHQRASRAIQRASSLSQRASRVTRLQRASNHRTLRRASRRQRVQRSKGASRSLRVPGTSKRLRRRRLRRIIIREICGESLSDVHVERAVKAQRRSQRGNALGQHPVQVRVGGARDVEVARASVV